MVHWRGLHVGGGLAPVGTDGLLHWGLLLVVAVGLSHGLLLAVRRPVVGGAVVRLLLLLRAAVGIAAVAAAVGPLLQSPLLPALRRDVGLRPGRCGEADGLRLPPGPPRRLLRLLVGVLGDVEGLRVHRVVLLLLVVVHWLLLHLLRRLLLLLHPGGPGVVHHLLDLGLLLRQPRDVRLEVLQGVVHVLQVARVAVHVAAVGGRLPGRRRRRLVVAQPPVLHGGKVVGHVLQEWKESNQCDLISGQGVFLCKSTI